MKKVLQIFMSLVLLGAGSAQSGKGERSRSRSRSPLPVFRTNPLHLKSDESRGFARAHADGGAGSGAGEEVVHSPLAAHMHKGAIKTDRDIAHDRIAHYSAALDKATKALSFAGSRKEKNELKDNIETLKAQIKMHKDFLKGR